MYLNRRGVQGLRKTQGGEARQGWAARRGGGDVEGSWRGRQSRRRGRPSPRSAPSSLNRSGLEKSWGQRGRDLSGTWPFKTLSTRNRWRLCWFAQLWRPYQQNPCCRLFPYLSMHKSLSLLECPHSKLSLWSYCQIVETQQSSHLKKRDNFSKASVLMK